MALHANKISNIWVPALSCADFEAQLQTGDILCLAGEEAISKAIEDATKSPWSHVGYVWILPGIEPLFIEAVFGQGVRISRLRANYIGSYNGDVVLCRRALPAEGIAAIIAKAISRVGTAYDWQSEVEQAAHMALGFVPEHSTPNELYCSGEVQYASTAWSPALPQPNPNVAPSPEDIYCAPDVLPICKLLKGTK